jgi:transposase
LILLDKFQSYTPSNRLYQRLEDQGVSLSAGTVTNGLCKLSPLFAPIAQAMQKQQAQETLFHQDETTWKVFEAVEGKIGYKGYLWVTRSASVISLTVATGRSTQVINEQFADHCKEPMVIVCDRYSAYKKFAREHADFVVLAFCWAHVRRDFLDAARSYPNDEAWMFQWVEAIGELYHLNQQRLEHWDKAKQLTQQTTLFNQYHQALLTAIEKFRLRITAALETEAPIKGEPETKRFKLATSLDNHWEGLTRFVENPLIPMDNNPAEQALRMPVAGRRSFYGSGSIWSAEFAVLMMGWIKTLQIWKLNPHAWLTTYLQACAENGSAPPDDISSFLPWSMDEERLEYFQKPEVSRMG